MGILFTLSKMFDIKGKKTNIDSDVDIEEIDLDDLINNDTEESSFLKKVQQNIDVNAKNVGTAITTEVEHKEKPPIARVKDSNKKSNIKDVEKTRKKEQTEQEL